MTAMDLWVCVRILFEFIEGITMDIIESFHVFPSAFQSCFIRTACFIFPTNLYAKKCAFTFTHFVSVGFRLSKKRTYREHLLNLTTKCVNSIIRERL